MASGPVAAWRSPAVVLAAAVVVLALVPSVGTVGAPWIAEDAAILARVGAGDPFDDWGRPWFGLELVRFWRPLVTTTWDVQESATGIATAPLRAFNLALHAGTALVALALSRRTGAGRGGALVAGAWVALFPEQGGTSTWIAGRTDLLVALAMGAGVLAALGRARAARLASAPLAFLACAAKEFGFLAPAWVFLLALGRGERARAAAVRAVPALAGTLVAFAWRAWALGGVGGGYPAPRVPLLAGLAGSATALVASAWPSLAALAFLLAAGAATRRIDVRSAGAALAAAALALVPLWPLLCDGHLEPENRRLLYVPGLAAALAAGAAFARPGAVTAAALGSARTVALVACALVALGARGVLAWRDTHDWARAAREGEARVSAARAVVAGATPGTAPVLFRGFPASLHGAYCLGFGLSARFRAPFDATPRPVWPWRLLFAHHAGRERAPLVPERSDGSIRPLDDPLRVPELAVRDAEGRPVAAAFVDESAVRDERDLSPVLELEGPPGALVEGVVFSELGYEPLPLTALDASGRGRFSLMQLLAATGGSAAGAEVLAHVADLGATRAMLELRAYGPDGAVVAASRWIELTWSPELLALARPR